MPKIKFVHRLLLIVAIKKIGHFVSVRNSMNREFADRLGTEFLSIKNLRIDILTILWVENMLTEIRDVRIS